MPPSPCAPTPACTEKARSHARGMLEAAALFALGARATKPQRCREPLCRGTGLQAGIRAARHNPATMASGGIAHGLAAFAVICGMAGYFALGVLVPTTDASMQ